MIIASVHISLGIGAAGMYFVLPYIFPNMTRSPPTVVPQTGVIEMKSVQISDDVFLFHGWNGKEKTR